MMNIDVKQLEMAKRIYNGKMTQELDKDGNVIASDELALKKLVNSAFDNNGQINNYQAYRDLNRLIVVSAEELGKADFQAVVNVFADYEKVGLNDIKIYELPVNRKQTTVKATATGAGVDFTRIPSYKKQEVAVPAKHQFGVKYNISRMISDPVNEFGNAVNYVREEKVKYILSQIYTIAREYAGVGVAKIPTKQTYTGAGITFPEFRAIESSLLRYGRNARPVLIADPAFIANLADKQATVLVNGTTTPQYLTDELRTSLLSDVVCEQIGRTIAINLDNPYTDKMNSKVDLPVNEGIMIAGGTTSPFKVTEFGDLMLLEDSIQNHIETEDVFLKISYKVDVTLIATQAIAYIKDTSVTL